MSAMGAPPLEGWGKASASFSKKIVGLKLYPSLFASLLCVCGDGDGGGG